MYGTRVLVLDRGSPGQFLELWRDRHCIKQGSSLTLSHTSRGTGDQSRPGPWSMVLVGSRDMKHFT